MCMAPQDLSAREGVNPTTWGFFPYEAEYGRGVRCVCVRSGNAPGAQSWQQDMKCPKRPLPCGGWGWHMAVGGVGAGHQCDCCVQR